MNIMHSMVLKQINSESLELIDKPMPTLSEWAFDEFYRNGNRVNYEKTYFERRKMLAVYGLKAMTDGDGVDAETLDKLNYVLFEILTEDTWALPAHVNKYGDPDWERTVDLFACETASAVGLIYKYAGKYLPDFLKDCMVREVKTRVLNPFFKEGKSFGWEGCSHNWNAVCTGGIGIALLTLSDAAGFSASEKADGIARIKRSLLTYLDTAFSQDGVSLEGVGYFNYGMGFYLAFASELQKWGDASLLYGDENVKERLRCLAAFLQGIFLKNGHCINFSDAMDKDKILPGVAKGFRLAGIELNLAREAYADFYTDTCYRFAGLWLGLDEGNTPTQCMYPVENKAKRKLQGGTCFAFTDAQWVVLQSENNCAFAIKGGCNAEPHNHNDVGSFIYYVGETCVACDLGQGEYTADYFGGGRYDNLCCSSKGHSVPVVAGRYQAAGEKHRASSFRIDEKEDAVTIEIEYHNAYPEGTCGILTRKAVFNLVNGSLTLTDTCDSEFLSAVVSREEPEITVHTGEWLPGRVETYSNHSGVPEKVKLEYIKAKEINHEILADGDNSRRLFSASFSLSAGLF